MSQSKQQAAARCNDNLPGHTVPPCSSGEPGTGSVAAWFRDALTSDPESGQALIEIAICLPVLLLVTFGLCTFGIAMSNYLVLEDSTNVGARQLAISRGQSTDPCSTTSASVIAAAPNLVRANLGFTYSINGTAYSGTSCTGAASNMVQGTTARLSVTYPCSLVSYRWTFSPTCTLTASTAELIQ